MNVLPAVLALLDEVLALQGRALAFTTDTPLLGALPELDSMAVMDLLTAMQQRFGFEWRDDELDGQIFATVGHLAAFIEEKSAGALAR